MNLIVYGFNIVLELMDSHFTRSKLGSPTHYQLIHKEIARFMTSHPLYLRQKEKYLILYGCWGLVFNGM